MPCYWLFVSEQQKQHIRSKNYEHELHVYFQNIWCLDKWVCVKTPWYSNCVWTHTACESKSQNLKLAHLPKDEKRYTCILKRNVEVSRKYNEV